MGYEVFAAEIAPAKNTEMFTFVRSDHFNNSVGKICPIPKAK
jgi:hypothetical protein